ncbi:hypothetical protein K449DRAFT_248927 [Hypoxylon sp. EC38]|nr:hypothetical protein K449DRAFT_248927 [Hypoxylon sp. EC38]
MEFNTAGKREGKGIQAPCVSFLFFPFLSFSSYLILRQGSTDSGQKGAVIMISPVCGRISSARDLFCREVGPCNDD